MHIFALLFFQAFASSPNSDSEILGSDGPWNIFGVSGYAGTITMNALTRSSIFYWMFEAIDGNITSDSLPLMIWLFGGPGCSGSEAMIWEYISPIHLYPTGQPGRTPLELTWGTDFHILSIDFPYGTGYSYANSPGDNKNTTLGATYYLWQFLNKLNAKYPTWFKREVYIFGESYGGHWVPGIAYNILIQNALNPTGFVINLKGIGLGDPWVHPPTGFVINLKGIGLGDPWVDPASQTQSYSTFGVSNSLINEYQQSIINLYQNQISGFLKSGQLDNASATWENLMATFISFSQVNKYDIRTFVEYDFDDVATFMNSQSTRNLLNAPSFISWVDCNQTVFQYYQGDIMNSTLPLVEYVLSQNVSVIIYQGQDDLIVPTTSTQAMISKINWSGALNFTNSPKVNWIVNGTLAGYAQSYSYLTFVSILGSGHMTDYYQPYNVKQMVLNFANANEWN
ncbi:hypothetical protein SteCoe_34255 [Stentor coeruleus]|uniref:Carboxypeptidase n=1 Tax=Stentor coeruleus TaxID=5963 RepID=A0A1R2AUY6_9CILI|nr:hypothetical protein SteCoe_34255 [Stentor coeruleus]